MFRGVALVSPYCQEVRSRLGSNAGLQTTHSGGVVKIGAHPPPANFKLWMPPPAGDITAKRMQDYGKIGNSTKKIAKVHI